MTAIARGKRPIAWRLASLALICAAAAVPAGLEAHGGIYHYAERPIPGGLAAIALVTGLIVGLALLSAPFANSAAGWPYYRRLLTAVAGVAIMAVPISGAAWSFAASNGSAIIVMQPGDELLADAYSGDYGGLVIPHHFGEGKTVHNPPDILEAGGYIVDLTYTADGQRVDQFTLQTLRGKPVTLLVRPEIVPANWNPWEFQVYRDCNCMVAVHFTERDVGKVAIVLFEVSSAMFD